ncbi:uncharacterized protein LOC143251715 [Tachypleus tridentatus]|uniref:uncharacterized protein LOC143251715 n=1 Tax=Tachypleus tridentatus TaxID=6853 RepID=UPI003FD6A09D
MDPSCLVLTVEVGGGIMVWEMFSWDTLGPLTPVEHHSNATASLALLLTMCIPLWPQSSNFSVVTSKRIILHVAKHASFHAGSTNMTVTSVYSNGLLDPHISIQQSTFGMRWNGSRRHCQNGKIHPNVTDSLFACFEFCSKLLDLPNLAVLRVKRLNPLDHAEPSLTDNCQLLKQCPRAVIVLIAQISVERPQESSSMRVHPRNIKEDDILKSELKLLAVPTIIPGHPRYKQVVQSQSIPLPRKRVPEIKQTYPVPAKKKKKT